MRHFMSVFVLSTVLAGGVAFAQNAATPVTTPNTSAQTTADQAKPAKARRAAKKARKAAKAEKRAARAQRRAAKAATAPPVTTTPDAH